MQLTLGNCLPFSKMGREDLIQANLGPRGALFSSSLIKACSAAHRRQPPPTRRGGSPSSRTPWSCGIPCPGTPCSTAVAPRDSPCTRPLSPLSPPRGASLCIRRARRAAPWSTLPRATASGRYARPERPRAAAQGSKRVARSNSEACQSTTSQEQPSPVVTDGVGALR